MLERYIFLMDFYSVAGERLSHNTGTSDVDDMFLELEV